MEKYLKSESKMYIIMYKFRKGAEIWLRKDGKEIFVESE